MSTSEIKDKSPHLSRAVMERMDDAETDQLIHDAAAAIVKNGWTLDDFAHRVVGLLIRDEGVLNKYERTIRLSLRIFREAEKIKGEPLA